MALPDRLRLHFGQRADPADQSADAVVRHVGRPAGRKLEAGEKHAAEGRNSAPIARIGVRRRPADRPVGRRQSPLALGMLVGHRGRFIAARDARRPRGPDRGQDHDSLSEARRALRGELSRAAVASGALSIRSVAALHAIPAGLIAVSFNARSAGIAGRLSPLGPAAARMVSGAKIVGFGSRPRGPTAGVSGGRVLRLARLAQRRQPALAALADFRPASNAGSAAIRAAAKRRPGDRARTLAARPGRAERSRHRRVGDQLCGLDSRGSLPPRRQVAFDFDQLVGPLAGKRPYFDRPAPSNDASPGRSGSIARRPFARRTGPAARSNSAWDEGRGGRGARGESGRPPAIRLLVERSTPSGMAESIETFDASSDEFAEYFTAE